MCIVLYLGAEERLPLIPYDLTQPAFNTKELDEQERPVRRHFSLPHVLYIGSNEGCGCSFRHVLYDGEEWSYGIGEEGEEAETSQADHQALVNYLKASELQKVEIYACWDGDYEMPPAFEEEIAVEDILQPGFFFKERAHYSIMISS